MNRSKNLSWGAYIVIMSAFFVTTVHAQDGDVSEVWGMYVKDGQSEAFEAAFAKHVSARKKAKDRREWNVYIASVGDSVGHYVVRYCCETWAQLDSYEAWRAESQITEQWNKTVGQYVARYTHHLEILDRAGSQWPEDDADIRMVGVTTFHVKPGDAAAVAKAKANMSQTAKRGGWSQPWAWLTVVGGKGGLVLSSAYTSYADMAPPEQSFVAFLAEQLGSREDADKLWANFSNNIQSSDYTIYRHLPHLSLKY